MLRILLVDDENIIRESLSKMFDWDDMGYELVGTACNGMDAYDKICDLYPDVVITDIRMPFLSGLELIRKLKLLDQNIIFVILSGYGEFEYAKQAMELGVQYFLLKPTNVDELKAVLLEIVRKKRQSESDARKVLDEFYDELEFPLQKALVSEALLNECNMQTVMRDYGRIINGHTMNVQLCIITYLEESMLSICMEKIRGMYKKWKVQEKFSPIYVNHVLILLLDISELTGQILLTEFIRYMELPYLSTSLEVTFTPFNGVESAFCEMIHKIKRFGVIKMINKEGEIHLIRNHRDATWGIESQYKTIMSCDSPKRVTEIVCDILPINMNLSDAYTLSICMITKLYGEKTEDNEISIINYVEKLYKAKTVSQVRAITESYINKLLQIGTTGARKGNDLIEELKKYVENHFDMEELSLKWIAENQLYVSVSYLSRQFTKSCNVNFSEYLNTIRIERAKQLLECMPGGSVQEIAELVGFGSNSGYFSQVFRKYAGLTPSAYIQKVNGEKDS